MKFMEDEDACYFNSARVVESVKGEQGLPDTMSDDEKEDMLERAHSALLLKDCPEPKGKKKDNIKMADAGVVEDNSDGADVLSVTISSSDGGWILDTGCSYHMCPNRDWFVTYRSFDGGKVLTGNDVTCKVVGIGSIQIKMHDGIVRTLTDVRHVPELRKILIFLGAAAASSSDINSNTTKLWHMCLGHMSERGMDVLSKQGLLGSKKIGKLDFCEHCVFGKQCKGEGGARGSSSRLPIIPTDEDDGSYSIEENEEPQEQQYNIAKNRPRREIRPPQKYGYADMVAYALSVAESIDVEKPVTYKEAIKSAESADMMTKHIPEIKFKHCLYLISISSIWGAALGGRCDSSR
ncbi:hypothetical protein RJ639_012236 [Escallonia herrerae]|uniref:GAG-pre-integrase domain-containing protein n=1 Tax=Escallonia herrerae TaxID=1293975 RepID=A0AA88VMS8_9ASTE|nr:hypothetical protein RJ639_012236 [Escallonia herrerae]